MEHDVPSTPGPADPASPDPASPDPASPTAGIPGMLGIEHIGLTVPDLEQAHQFLVDVIGAVHVYTLPGKRSDTTDWMHEHLGVHPRTTIEEIRFYRVGNGANLEVFQYHAADGQAPHPRNSDLGGQHLALYVTDMDAAIAHLRAHGVELMGGTVASAGPAEGQHWQYFRAPWGQQFELVSYPHGKAYERTSPVHLWHPGGDSATHSER